jgi:betaine lipid synthase
MASLIPSTLLRDPHTQIYFVGAILVLLIGVIFALTFCPSSKEDEENPSAFKSFLRFFYASFLKPHTGDGTGNGQQDALESFYKAQAGVYDSTRKRLLRGREDMLGLVAAQLVHKAATERTHDAKRIWVDVSVPNPIVGFGANMGCADWRRYWLEHRIYVGFCLGSGVLLERLPC